MATKLLESITGGVEAVNEKGVKVAGAWHNFSRFADVPRPSKGQQVRLHVERTEKGTYISAVEFPDEASTSSNGHAAPAADRERTITRLAVLKAAAEFAAARPGATSADVLKVAETWEAWVLR